MQKIIRSICYFAEQPNTIIYNRLKYISKRLENAGFEVQTMRLCCSKINDVASFANNWGGKDMMLGIGSKSRAWRDTGQGDAFLSNKNPVAFYQDLTEDIDPSDIDWLFRMINEAPEKMFHFAFSFNNVYSSPFFPSSQYERNGFSIGLQPTQILHSSDDWDESMRELSLVWWELKDLLENEADFLGLDSSIAPLYGSAGSFAAWSRRVVGSFESSILSDFYTKTSNFIKTQNPQPVGLCGLMFPCLEDFELADAYMSGNFSIERNLFLSLHSGLGIDTYPIATDESKMKVFNILQLVQQLSNKYKKPLAIRFVSDGKAKIGEQSNFNNPYLKDVVLRAL